MSILLGHLEGLLGKSSPRARENYAFHCPFCNHHKPKLEIKLTTNEKGENPFECWVCHTRGRTIRSLLKQLNVDREKAQEVLSCVQKGSIGAWESHQALELPKEFIPLSSASKTSIYANRVRKFLYTRGLNDVDIYKYNIGYCDSGAYDNRIIIPSFNEDGQLNYFVGRSLDNKAYSKYKNPSASKNIIPFENLINFEQPIILVEGMFDAIAAKRNAIPILGTNIPEALMLKLVLNSVEDIYIALDRDALKHALDYTQELFDMGKNVYLVDMGEKDPSEMGFEAFTKHIQTATQITSEDLFKHKLESKL